MSKKYFLKLSDLLTRIKATDQKNKLIPIEQAIASAEKLVRDMDKNVNKAIFIGNGGSASISSHISTDLLKNCQVPALAFNDASLLTCISNDLGYDRIFEKPVEMLSTPGDVLFAISSSGRSMNILKAVNMGMKKGCSVITLSGFDKSNPLRKIGQINFYLDSHSYGYVEIAHLAICHCIVDGLMGVE